MLGHEGRQPVHLLLDVGDAGARYLLKFVADLLLIVLELFDVAVHIVALTSAIVDEVVDGGAPVMASYSWLDGLLEVHEMVIEESCFFLVDRVLDVVVVTDDEHDALSGDSELLFSAVQLCNRVRDVAVAKGRDLLPVCHLSQDLVQRAVEVALQQTTPGLLEQGVLQNLLWNLFGLVLRPGENGDV